MVKVALRRGVDLATIRVELLKPNHDPGKVTRLDPFRIGTSRDERNDVVNLSVGGGGATIGSDDRGSSAGATEPQDCQ